MHRLLVSRRSLKIELGARVLTIRNDLQYSFHTRRVHRETFQTRVGILVVLFPFRARPKKEPLKYLHGVSRSPRSCPRTRTGNSPSFEGTNSSSLYKIARSASGR